MASISDINQDDKAEYKNRSSKKRHGAALWESGRELTELDPGLSAWRSKATSKPLQVNYFTQTCSYPKVAQIQILPMQPRITGTYGLIAMRAFSIS